MDKDNDFIEEPKTERIFIRISDKEKKKLKESQLQMAVAGIEQMAAEEEENKKY